MAQNVTSAGVGNASDPSVAPSKSDKALYVAEKFKIRAKRILGRDDSDSADDSDHDVDLLEDAAFNPQQAQQTSPNEKASLRDKLHRGAHGLAAAIKNPKRAARSNYARTIAGNLSGEPTSYEKQYDAELLDAHDALQCAHEDAKSTHQMNEHTRGNDITDKLDNTIYLPGTTKAATESPKNNVEIARERLEKVEAQRDSLRTAWILGRHVRRIRVARPTSHHPVKSDFMTSKPDGQGQTVQWNRYLSHLALYHAETFSAYHIDDFDEPPFDMKELSLTIERLAVASAPWQNFIIDVRSIYLWENPRRTAKFMLLYWVLWYLEHIVTAAFAWIIVATVTNRYFPTRIETIRKRVDRAENEHAKAEAWGELIQRHGRHDWIEPLLDDLGPHIQLGLSDLSNLLELLQSFYRWERPRKTVSTLGFCTCCLLVTFFADLDFCVRLVWFGIGCTFFFVLPLSAKFPKYRRLVNPIYWVFWGIPNFAEIGLVHLQEKAVMRDAAMLRKTQRSTDENGEPQLSSSSDDDKNELVDGDVAENSHLDTQKDKEAYTLRMIREDDHATFRAIDSTTHTNGRLRLQRDGLWFYDKTRRLFYPYERLSEVRKIEVHQANNPDASRVARIARRLQESTSLQFLPSGLELVFLPRTPQASPSSTSTPNAHKTTSEQDQLILTVSEADRDKIFSLIVAWSNLKWQPLFSMNKRNRLSPDSSDPAKAGKGNENLDGAIKSFVE